MKNLFQLENKEEIVSRINKLTPNSQKKWGKMDVAQMMAHCSAAFEVALSERKRPRVFLGYLFGRMAKKQFVYSTEYTKNSPTDSTFKIVDTRDFEKEKARLLSFIDRFYHFGPEGIHEAMHPFFGKMTGLEWAQLKYNHLHHHLSQFGV